MYIPRYTRVADTDRISRFIRENPFGILLSTRAGLPEGTHLPFILESSAETGGIITTHVARANPLWETVNSQVIHASEEQVSSGASTNALVIFHGPHTYVSSSWYEKNDGIPTWNYTSVHAYGHAETVHEEHENLRILKRTIERFDPNLLSMWDDPTHLGYFTRMSRGIVGIKFTISRLEAKFKLSQNRTDEDFRRVVERLEGERSDEQSHRVARMMRELAMREET